MPGGIECGRGTTRSQRQETTSSNQARTGRPVIRDALIDVNKRENQ
jgi:hypothetical protein